MSVIAAVLRELMAAGLKGEDLVAAIERIEAAKEPRRSANAEACARYRAKKQHVTTCHDMSPAPLPPKQKVPPITPSKTQPPIPLAAVVAREEPEHIAIGRQILFAMGLDFGDPTWMGDIGRVAQWLANHWDVDLDILPTIRKLMARRPDNPPRSLKFFEQAIADAFASRTAPVPTGKPENARAASQESPIRAAINRSLAGLGGARELRFGENDVAPRLVLASKTS